jgi:hypothetical protein
MIKLVILLHKVLLLLLHPVNSPEAKKIVDESTTRAVDENSTVAEIKAYLDSKGISYLSNDNKTTLLSKIGG